MLGVEGDQPSRPAGAEGIGEIGGEIGGDHLYDCLHGGVEAGGRGLRIRERAQEIAEAEGVGEGEGFGQAQRELAAVEAHGERGEAAGIEIEEALQGRRHGVSFWRR